MSRAPYLCLGLNILVNRPANINSSPEETQSQFDANVFGPLNLFRAVLPHMRSKRSGTLVTIGSMAAWMRFPACNLYDTSKAAVRMISLGLDTEVSPLGIKTCLVEPGYFRTDLLGAQNKKATNKSGRIADYTEANKVVEDGLGAAHQNQAGDPVKAAEVMFDVFTSSGVAKGREVPKFLPLGSDAVEEVIKYAQEAIDDCKTWKDIASMTDFPKA